MKNQKRNGITLIQHISIPAVALFIEEYIWNEKIFSIDMRMWMINYLVVFIMTTCILLLCRRKDIGYTVTLSIALLYGVANHYVLEFKGCPPMFSDILAANTAATVMGSYEFVLSKKIIYAVLLTGGIIAVLWFCPLANRFDAKNTDRKKRYLHSGICIIASICLFMGMLHMDLGKIWNVQINGASPVESFYANGAPATMLLSYQNMKQEKPQGYDKDQIRERLIAYNEENTIPEELPTVIAIMNESFSDLKVIGDFGSEEYLENYKSLENYVMKGNVYASVIGGGTCNSEFEFLTGNSMRNMKAGVYPYQNMDLKYCNSISSILKDAGYVTAAFHPYDRKNWNRENIYNYFSFDTFYDDTCVENKDIISWTVSDRADYKDIIEIYEESKTREEPLFLFNVTMQNHGGYKVDIREDIELLEIEDQYKEYEDVVNYLTLIRESDEALGELLAYFSKEEKPVIICMFGDHQPMLDTRFFEEIKNTDIEDDAFNLQTHSITPYVIWSNYDMGIEPREVDMGINYLGANLLNIIGIHNEYTDYLLELQKEIPIVNVSGYQTADGKWHGNTETHPLLEEYRQIQYYQLTEKKKR